MVCHPYYIGLEYPLDIIFFLINIICAAICVSGNGIVIYVTLTVKQLQNPSGWLLMALASADLLAGAIAQPMFAIYHTFFHDSDICNIQRAIIFISATSCSTSILLLCLIAYDRYLHVFKGLTYNQFTSELKTSLQIVGSWTLGVATGGTFMLNGSGFEQYIGFAVFLALQIISFVYISVIYLKIKKFLKRHFREMHDILETSDRCDVTKISAAKISKEKLRLSAEKRYNNIMLMIISLFVVVWFPFMIILITGTAYQIMRDIPGIWLPNAFMWTASLTYVNGAINPFIYAIGYKKTGSEIRKIFRKRSRKVTPWNSNNIDPR